jgi:hypothetical protein
MKKLFTTIALSSCIFSFSDLLAQKNVVASGGNGSGSGGTVSYSVGQIDYSGKNGTGGSTNEGTQQPYEIFIITSVSEHAIELSVKVYPNPTIDIVSLKIEDHNLSTLKYIVADETGKVIFRERIVNPLTEINFHELSAGIYFLKVSDDNETTKIFKIIKNK